MSVKQHSETDMDRLLVLSEANLSRTNGQIASFSFPFMNPAYANRFLANWLHETCRGTPSTIFDRSLLIVKIHDEVETDYLLHLAFRNFLLWPFWKQRTRAPALQHTSCPHRGFKKLVNTAQVRQVHSKSSGKALCGIVVETFQRSTYHLLFTFRFTEFCPLPFQNALSR